LQYHASEQCYTAGEELEMHLWRSRVKQTLKSRKAIQEFLGSAKTHGTPLCWIHISLGIRIPQASSGLGIYTSAVSVWPWWTPAVEVTTKAGSK